MKYMGSKNRIAKYILPIILKDREPDQWYVEPFVGGANMIDKVDGNRIGADFNYYLISTLKAVQSGWEPPEKITEDEYKNIKENMSDYDAWLVGYVGFQLSYGAKWFDSYRRDSLGARDYSMEAHKNIMKQAPSLAGVNFILSDYRDLTIPEGSIIYCDPPYQGTTRYKSINIILDHKEFWQWCRDKAKEGHKVFVSEYNAPDDFECLWQKEIVSSLTKNTGAKNGVEKLFRPKL